ncbi:MAG: UDP-N-acetylmuramoyl-L-alanine--D-glutamate ligase [Thermoflexus hugenholtzii]|jgi:UDP-N-acetylmuramoylalanine--D-glutamate ligase|uniref:UDP-N-acetylmuramoyl-L-alanine--D-glutamate ligase n=1 Tax=Thermoflexus TaxID=1495649 RepID=UPI001C76B8EB|nr:MULTISPECIES: UDP-N-acetylmuramoyl-L-alanine--D-glutamate ligase [Thermoflexus]QWK11062.1 MAG: UDP-N-acetylmuramoyl-L-alanine--D-glutamate ligase [Thermoflexus hugenholtzii]
MRELKGARVVILGLGRQGTALARWLVRQGAEVTVSDRQPAERLGRFLQALEGLPVRYVLGDHPLSLLEGCDLLCLSGGVPLDIPIVQEAVRRGIPLANDAQLFLERCRGWTAGITGTSGKTTTTALVGAMCQAAGFRTWVGGNIGNPLIEFVEEIGPEDRVILELSSFQLEIMTVSPRVAAVLNIAPNHLDRHKTMEAYIAAKQRILDFQDVEDVAVLGYDDPNARSLAAAVRGRLRFFSREREVARGAFLREGTLFLRLGSEAWPICRVEEVRLRGRHNLWNVLAAAAVAGSLGADIGAIREAVLTFSGVPHRLERVREVRGVLYVNDSIATTPERVRVALEAFEEPIVLLAGGRDKGLPWEETAEVIARRVRVLIAFGELGDRIVEAARAARARVDGVVLEHLERVATLEEAVARAAGLARPGEVVLLSPGGTSFDAYRDFEERGMHFRQLVEALS